MKEANNKHNRYVEITVEGLEELLLRGDELISISLARLQTEGIVVFYTKAKLREEPYEV